MEISNDELPALIAVLVAGKFKKNPDDWAVAASPIVAAIVGRAASALIEYQITKYGPSYEKHALVWRDLENHQEERTIACQYAAEQFCRDWSSWDSEKQRGVIDNLISPFILDEDGRAAFVNEFLSKSVPGDKSR